jgi:hypothetical protein
MKNRLWVKTILTCCLCVSFASQAFLPMTNARFKHNTQSKQRYINQLEELKAYVDYYTDLVAVVHDDRFELAALAGSEDVSNSRYLSSIVLDGVGTITITLTSDEGTRLMPGSFGQVVTLVPSNPETEVEWACTTTIPNYRGNWKTTSLLDKLGSSVLVGCTVL